MKIATSQSLWYRKEISEIQITEHRSVIFRKLNGENTLFPILKFRHEIVGKVRFQAITRLQNLSCIFHYFFQITGIDGSHFIFLILTISLIQIRLSQISRCRIFVRSSQISLLFGQIIECKLKIFNDLIPHFHISQSYIGYILILVLGNGFIYKGNILEKNFQQEIEMSSQKAHFCLSGHLIRELFLRYKVQRIKSCIHTGNTAILRKPISVRLVKSGYDMRTRFITVLRVTVVCPATAFISIIGTNISPSP